VSNVGKLDELERLPGFLHRLREGFGLAVRNVVIARAMHEQHGHADLGRAMHRRYRSQVDFGFAAHAVAPVAVPRGQQLVSVMAHHVVEIGDSRPADRAPEQPRRPDGPHQCRVPAIRGAHDADALRVDGALGDQPLHRISQVVLHSRAPLAETLGEVFLAVPRRAAEVGLQHDVTAIREELHPVVVLPAVARVRPAVRQQHERKLLGLAA
jgi:hypothetical protein